MSNTNGTPIPIGTPVKILETPHNTIDLEGILTGEHKGGYAVTIGAQTIWAKRIEAIKTKTNETDNTEKPDKEHR